MAGYSGTPLPKKLGIREDSVLAVIAGPESFSGALGELPPGVTTRESLRGKPDVVVLHVTRSGVLRGRLRAAARSIYPAGGLWVAWPKRASGVDTDMSEDLIRELALPLGLVDNKVCAIDETWSGLRLVWRRELRTEPSPPLPA